MSNDASCPDEPAYEVVWPLAPAAHRERKLNARLVDLNGKTICELWDELFRGETMFPAIRAALRARYPTVRFVDYTHFGNPHGPRQKDIIAGLAGKLHAHGCDAVISAIGA